MSNSLHFRDYKPDKSAPIIGQGTDAVRSPTDPRAMDPPGTEYDTSTIESYDATEVGQAEVQGSPDNGANSGGTRFPEQVRSVIPTVAPKVQPVFPDPEALPPPPAANALEVALAAITLAAVVFVILALCRSGSSLGVVALGLRRRLF